MKYRLVAIDLDGPLVNREGFLRPGIDRAIKFALDHGLQVTLATGRMYRPSARFARALGLSLPIICYQGALIRQLGNHETLWHKPLTSRMAQEVIRQSRLSGVHLYLYIDDELFVEELNERNFWYAHRNKAVLNYMPDLLQLDKVPTEIVVWGETADIDRAAAALEAALGKDLFFTRSYPAFCEINHPESGKGKALAFLAERLGIPQNEVVAIGDGPNDVSMFNWAGLGIAVGKVLPEVAAAAGWVVEGEPENTMLSVIERLIID